jgi:hypothetical protein
MSENFIYKSYVSHEICDKLIEYHKKSDLKQPGQIGCGYVNKNAKDSIDIKLWINDKVFLEYCKELKTVIDEYIKKFPYCVSQKIPFGFSEVSNLQYYPPGGGFKIWHAERFTKKEPQSSRHLVYMTYLNDVTDGGETEFLHQKIKVRAEKGKTLVWPADWTHTHRGIVSPTQEKYIITGWLSFTQ